MSPQYFPKNAILTRFFQIDKDIDQFKDISVVDLATQAHKKFDSHYHLGHYVIKDNRVYSRMIGKAYFNVSMDFSLKISLFYQLKNR